MMHRFLSTLVACTALSAGCEPGTRDVQERQKTGVTTPSPSTTLGDPMELSSGVWSITLDVDVPTLNQRFVTPSNDDIASALLDVYQRTFHAELQKALRALLQRNVHCTISALSITQARQVWLDHPTASLGGPMALPSGAIVILPCGGNEPLAKPTAPTPPMPH